MRACIHAHILANTHIHTIRTCLILLFASCKQLEKLKEPFSDSFIMEDEQSCFLCWDNFSLGFPLLFAFLKKGGYFQVYVHHMHLEALYVLK